MNTLEEAVKGYLQIIALATFFSLTNTSIAVRLGFFRYPPRKIPVDSSIRLIDVVCAFAVFLFVQIIFVPVAAFVWLDKLKFDSHTQGWVNVIAMATAAMGIFLYYRFLVPHTKRIIWGVGNKSSLKNFIYGASTWLISYPIVLAIGQIIALTLYFFFNAKPVDQAAVKYLKSTMEHPLLFGIMVIAITCVVPIIEEILFRGFLQSWMRERWNRGKAIVFSSLIFALFHYSIQQGINNIEVLSVLFILSCYLGYLYERQQTLWAPIGLHVCFNSLSVLMLFWEHMRPT